MNNYVNTQIIVRLNYFNYVFHPFSFNGYSSSTKTSSKIFYNQSPKETTYKSTLTLNFPLNNFIDSFQKDLKDGWNNAHINGLKVTNGTVIYSHQYSFESSATSDFQNMLAELGIEKNHYNHDLSYQKNWFDNSSKIKTQIFSKFASGRVDKEIEVKLGPTQCAKGVIKVDFYQNISIPFVVEALFDAHYISEDTETGENIVVAITDVNLINLANQIFKKQFSDNDLTDPGASALKFNTTGYASHDFLYNQREQLVGCDQCVEGDHLCQN